MLDFASGTGSDNLRCEADLQCRVEQPCPAWSGKTIVAKEPTTFTVKIGLSGGTRGYQAITGRDTKTYGDDVITLLYYRPVWLGYCLLH